MAAETIRTFKRGSVEEKKFRQLIDGEYTQVQVDLAEALEAVLRDRRHADTWLDIADQIVVALSGKVALVGKKEYDDMVTSLRSLVAKP